MSSASAWVVDLYPLSRIALTVILGSMIEKLS